MFVTRVRITGKDYVCVKNFPLKKIEFFGRETNLRPSTSRETSRPIMTETGQECTFVVKRFALTHDPKRNTSVPHTPLVATNQFNVQIYVLKGRY